MCLPSGGSEWPSQAPSPGLCPAQPRTHSAGVPVRGVGGRWDGPGSQKSQTSGLRKAVLGTVQGTPSYRNTWWGPYPVPPHATPCSLPLPSASPPAPTLHDSWGLASTLVISAHSILPHAVPTPVSMSTHRQHNGGWTLGGAPGGRGCIGTTRPTRVCPCLSAHCLSLPYRRRLPPLPSVSPSLQSSRPG